jgi:GTPase
MSQKLPTVAIIGRANAGKSSLFNRLIRSRSAIVAEEAGTTRDNVFGTVTYYQQGQESQLLLVDTAGLKPAEDEFEASIQEQITEAVVAADAIILTADSTEYPDQELRRMAKEALKSKKPVLLALTKTDLRGALDEGEFLRLGVKTIIRTSSEHNIGISQLLDELGEQLPIAHSTEPDELLKIALIGRPNVGKSHLFNTLAGKQQAVVADVVGTTRDLNRARVTYHGESIELIDTAGIRKSGKRERGIEKFSVLRTMQAINESDVCFLLVDVNDLHVALDQKLAGMIDEAGKGLVLVITKWDNVADKDGFTHDALLPRIARHFDFVPWAPVIFTSAVTGQNVTKLYDLARDIMTRRAQQPRTRELNDLLQKAVANHPPAGLKNTHPRLRYIVHTDTNPPWFVIYGSTLKYLHWSYKRYLERRLRETFDYAGTPIKFSFRDEKQIKANKDSIAKGLEPMLKPGKQTKNSSK